MASFAGTTAARALGVLLCVFSLAGCVRVSRYLYLRGCDKDIAKATKSIEAGKSAAQQAAGYADRADAYAEKARYSRAFQLVSHDRYEDLFALAKKDYEQAIGLAPDNADFYFRRGRAFYFRAALDAMEGRKSSDSYSPAKADFSKAIEKNPRHELAFDMRGLVGEDTGDLDGAISDFAEEAALNAKSRYRLADAYCRRGSRHLADKNYDPAIRDLERAIDMGTASDACECEPYDPLVAIYLEKQDYGKARTVLDRAQKAEKSIAPEYREKLKSATAAHP
jgi:tetratricopeptide (TPR) repeat protein